MDHGGGNLSETQISRQTPSLPAYFDALDHVGTILTFIYARVGKCPAAPCLMLDRTNRWRLKLLLCLPDRLVHTDSIC
jgi:hypothetical protein